MLDLLKGVHVKTCVECDEIHHLRGYPVCGPCKPEAAAHLLMATLGFEDVIYSDRETDLDTPITTDEIPAGNPMGFVQTEMGFLR